MSEKLTKTFPLQIGSNDGYLDTPGVEILDAQGLAAALAIGDVPQLDAEALANYIVRACNAFPDLLDALRDCVDALTADTVGTIYMDNSDWYRRVDEAVAKARAALSKAESSE